MSTQSTTAATGGVSLLTVVGIVLLVLKLAKVIDLAWVWVLAPFWFPFAFVLAIFALVAFITGVLAIAKVLSK